MKELVQKRPITEDSGHDNETKTPEIIGRDGGGMKKILLFSLFMISVISEFPKIRA